MLTVLVVLVVLQSLSANVLQVLSLASGSVTFALGSVRNLTDVTLTLLPSNALAPSQHTCVGTCYNFRYALHLHSLRQRFQRRGMFP
jgi:hypothetical protein